MRCPDCGARSERYSRVCRKCGAPLPETAPPDYGPGVVGASDAETRWFVGPVFASVVIVIAIAMAVLMVVLYYHGAGKGSPDTTVPTTYSWAAAVSRRP